MTIRNRSFGVMLPLLIAAALALAACGGAATAEPTEEATAEATGEATAEATGEATAEATGEVPEEFEGLENPLAGDAEAIAAGETIYQDNCATCHGETGLGDGPAAGSLPEEPAPVGDCEWQEHEEDGELFFVIVEGREDDGMPAWGEKLTEDEIWQSLSYIRSLCE